MMDRHWDNQLDNMLDDLQATVVGGVGENSLHSTSHQHGDSRNGGIAESRKEKNVTGGPNFKQVSSSSYQHSAEWRTSDGQPQAAKQLVDDLSSIEKVKAVSKVSTSSSSRVEYYSSNTTQQNIKKNIHDLDHLLNDLSQGSSRDVSPSMPRRPSSRGSFVNNQDLRSESRTSFQSSRSEERRERLMQNTLQRTPSLNRAQRRPGNLPATNSRPTTPLDNLHNDHQLHNSHPPRSPHIHDHNSHQAFSYMKHTSTSSAYNNEFSPVHTTPDPLTGRYADGRITPNHGFTRTFTDSSSRGDNANGSIPRRPDELLQNFGEEIDRTELEKINQEERITESKLNNNNNKGDFIEPMINKPGPPVYYPTEEMYSTKHVIAHGEYSKVKGSMSKEESDHKKGAAVVPVCLPLCCAAPCVIM